MKKILHLFSDPSHSALWSRYLRMLTLIALLAFGSHGVWGLGIKRNVSMTNVEVATPNGKFENYVYTWTGNASNLIRFKDLDNSDLSEYEKIVVPVSNWSSGVLRCVIKVKNEGGGTTDYTWTLYSKNSSSTPALKELELLGGSFENSGTKITKEQLQKVESVFFGGADSKGSATIGQIYLTKQLDWDENGKITIYPQDINCGSNVTKNGSSFTFSKQDASVTIDFIGDGISAKKLASASSSKPNPGFNIYYSIDDNYGNDQSSTSQLGESNVKKVKYACNTNPTTITITNFVLEYKDPITVTLNAGKGTINGSSTKTIKYCETPITLPAATPNDATTYVFNAWRNNGHVGNAGDKYTPTGDVTLTAHYTNKNLYYTTENGNCLGDDTKTVPTNTVFTPKYSIYKDTQREFTFICNRPQAEALNKLWYGWVLWAKPSSATGNVNDKPFYFWTNAQDTRYATDANTGIWDKSISSDIKISRDGKLYDMTPEERNTYLSDMGNSAQVTVKVAYFDNTIRMYAVMKSSDGARTYVQAYEYKGKEAYINNAASIDVYFSVDHAYLTKFIYDKAAVNLVQAIGNKDSESTGDGTVNIYTLEGYNIHNPANVGKGESVVFEAIPDAKSKFTKWGGSGITQNPRILEMNESKYPSATFVTKGLETITVDNNIRKYGIYVPDGVKNAATGTIPVIISLHGRDGNVDPVNGEAPNFNSIANTNNIIVVYPQGRHGDGQYTGFETGWNKGFEKTTGWEATGKKNGDTRFIEELVKEIKTKYPQADPERFYLCGFSMGGMMTYACAKVLNGTFAAYGSCGGFPLNEFHMNLATENPIPFIHLHGKDDTVLGIKHLHTIIENLLFRNGCKLSKKQNDDDGWTTTTENGVTRYNFKGVNGVPVTTVTFDGLGHSVHQSAPAYLWDFFSDKTVGKYDDTDIEWKWDMPTINANIPNSSSDSPYYGWKHEVNDKDRSLTYGGESKTDSNHNVYNSIQLTAGKHTLYAQMESTQGTSSVTLRNILTGAETVARKVEDNSGTTETRTYNVLYEFEVGEGAEFSLELKFSNTNSKCTLLEIHKGSYSPQGVKDESQDNATVNLNDGKLAELTFENGENSVDIYPLTSGNGADLTSNDGNMKLYLKSRLGSVKDGKFVNKDKYIVKDPVFGYYFQNIPDADIYDRYGASDYMRVVLGTNNSLSGYDGKDGIHIDGIQETGKVTIGFWVNGDLAVNRGLAYDEPSMFYIAGETYNGPNWEDNPHMFNITCSGGLSGYMNNGAFKYNSGRGSFGGLCDTKSNADFYKKNFYKDCNWHYITYQMYDNLSRYNMYVDGEPTCLGGYATHNAGSLDEYIKGLKSIVLGGANANNVTFAYDVAFAYDDIVIYNRVLSKREINKIIENKKYSPSVWHFDRNLENNIFCNRDLLDKNTNMWASSNGVYTLKTNFTTAAALTYDGITEIPAFKGLRFVTDGSNKIVIDAKSGALRLSQGVKVVFSNLVKDTYVRMEYKKNDNVGWNNNGLQNVPVFGDLPSPSQDCVRTYFKVGDATSEESSITITMPSDIDIIRMESTAKSFAQIKFVDKTDNVVSVVTNPSDENPLPRMDLYVNAVERLHTEDDKVKLPTAPSFKYTSSSPHVASIAADGTVTLHGIAGSTVITAELNNDKNEYDCDLYDQYAFEPSNRIFSSYEIVVEPKDGNGTFYKVVDGKTYTVGQTLYNADNTVGVTLGGWTYNNGSYYVNYQDSYTEKKPWAGHKFEKNADRNGYLANSRKTEEDVFHEFFNDTDQDGKYKKETFSTNGSHAAKSEQLNVDANHTYAGTGNYSAPTENKSFANVTPWLLPCRGSYIKIEPTDAGLISVYVMQEGCVSHDANDEPIDVTVKKVYVADEKGEIVKEVVADTKSKVAAQMWKDDGRARAEYRWGDEKFAYNKATMNSFTNNITDWNDKWSFLDNWPNPGMQQHVFKLGNDEYGHVLITKGIVRYTFNVLPGKTYYIFSNTAKLGLAGFTFKTGKHAKYDKVKPDAKHDEWRATGDFEDYDLTVKNVTLNDGENYPTPAPTAKNAEVTLNRKFYRNYWNAICLPYSINRRQIEKVFGDGTMVVLMNYIDTSKKKVMFIEHANQDIIAGYPYLIFPTTKADTEKKDHTAINGITTRATFGEADSPLFSVGTDGKTYPFTEPMQSDALVFKGTFTNNTPLTEGSYVVTNKGVLSRIPNDEMKIKPYRSYIYFNRKTAGAKAISLQDMNVNGFENDEDHTTGIENLLFESGILTHSADVYSIDGQLVRSKALNFNGLPKGVYIVNGKKYVKK